MAIQVLDQATVNKIAAGEVIERPASALKELLENSADSGASRVEIDFDGGGKKELRVTDNGRGMAPDELPLALHPHATSKISKIEDLMTLKTFGFRGEALASMAAVSELSIHSAMKSQDAGARIDSRGGEHGSVVPAPPIEGTRVVVKNLFFNVPARQKFLKSEAGETAAIKKVVRAFALSHPTLTITLRQNGKVVFHWEKENFAKRAGRVLELEPGQTLNLESAAEGFRLNAVLGLPEFSLPTQQSLWIFVQGRPVTDRTLSQSVMEGYRNLLMHHQYPRAVISLDVDPSTVDVNVHPTKAQVKFAQQGAVFRFLSSEIKRAFAKHFESVMNLPAQDDSRIPEPAYEQASLVQEAVTQYNRRVMADPGEPANDRAPSYHVPAAIKTPAVPAPSQETLAVGAGAWSSLQVIGQFSNTYIVAQGPKALVLIDQHAAHERVLFERLKRQGTGSAPEKQPALLEDLLTLPRESIEALTQGRFAEVLFKLGFELIDRGPETLAVASRPAFLSDVALKPLLERLAEQILEIGTSGLLDDVVTDLWASMACHGAIRAGRVLSADEMRALLQQMDEFAFSSFCPHGRPVSVRWTLGELEKLFKRIV